MTLPNDLNMTAEQLVRLCRQQDAEIERLRAEVTWLRAKPMDVCDSKCEYGKRGDPDGCFCGMAQWQATAPAHLRDAQT